MPVLSLLYNRRQGYLLNAGTHPDPGKDADGIQGRI
jgi:hypothetical protein